ALQFVHPDQLFSVLTLIAVPVPAGVVSYLIVTALITAFDMPAQCCRPALADRRESLYLIEAQLVLLQKCTSILLEYEGHIQWMSFVGLLLHLHGWSNGLLTEGSIAARCR